jgi:hypothetical protein
MGWEIRLAQHGARLNAMPNAIIRGRNIRDGYIRACGIGRGNVRALCEADPLFQRAIGAAKDRTLVDYTKFLNFYMLMTISLPTLPFGHIAEFGAYKGGSALFFAVVAAELYPDMKVFAFDTFEGMPETDSGHDAHSKGSFAASEDELRSQIQRLGLQNLELVKGLFGETMPRTLPSLGQLRMCHIDADIYESVATAYDGSKPYMVPGGYFVFDDPLAEDCLGAFEAVEDLVIGRDGLHAEQVFPHLVYRAPIS